MKKPVIVIVDDDETYARVLEFQLKRAGYNCEVFYTGDELINCVNNLDIPDLFILDYFLGSSKYSGLQLCRMVKTYYKRPVIMLTGNDDLDSTVSCLNAGAEQYILKPCNIRELVARIDVTLLRNKVDTEVSVSSSSFMLDERISLDPQYQALVRNDGCKVSMTEKEFGLLELILQSPNRSVCREKAFQILYGQQLEPMNRAIDVLVSRLRKKIGLLDSAYRINTVRGHGYKLCRLE